MKRKTFFKVIVGSFIVPFKTIISRSKKGYCPGTRDHLVEITKSNVIEHLNRLEDLLPDMTDREQVRGVIIRNEAILSFVRKHSDYSAS